LARAWEALAATNRRSDNRRTSLRLGSFGVHLIFDSDDLAEALQPQFAHIVEESQIECQLAIYVLAHDVLLQGLENEWRKVGLPGPNTSASFRSDRLRIHAEFDTFGLAAFSVLDVTIGTAVYVAANAKRARQIEGPYPFRVLLRWWTESTPYLWTHAAAVGEGGNGVLITGVGGSGKSSTALAVTGRRLQFLSDDYVLVGPDRVASSIYASLRIRQNMVSRFTSVNPWFGKDWFSWNGKPSQVVDEDRFAHLSRSVTVRAIVTLSHGHADGATFHHASAHAAMRAMSPVTISRYCANPQRALKKLAHVIAFLPVYEFHTTANLSEMREPFERFVGSLAA
jgi:hypothetical protein